MVFPRHSDDVAAASLGVPVVPRGAGTSLAGQTVGPGMVIDMSRHMDRIHEIDPEARTALVDVGVVQDQLNGAAAQHGLLFGPDTPTSNRATIGGMTGSGSVRYGMTIDHVRALDAVLSDGSRARFEPVDEAERERRARPTTLEGAIYRACPASCVDTKPRSPTTSPRSGAAPLARSEFNRSIFGEDLYEAMREVKRLFDPDNLMNPGKIVDAPAITENLRDADLPDAGPIRTRLEFDVVGGTRGAADRCMNIGVCRKSTTGVVYHGHCHQKAEVGTAATVALLNRIPGVEVVELDAGCCGMAGSFGFEAEHYDVSMEVGGDRLFPAVLAEPADTVLAATGVSCRQQIHHGTAREAMHPVELVRSVLADL